MKKIHMLTTAAGILFLLAGPSLAASRAHQGFDAYASSADRSGAYYYGPLGSSSEPARVPAYSAQDDTRTRGNTAPLYGYGPYPDRPYGDPDSW